MDEEADLSNERHLIFHPTQQTHTCLSALFIRQHPSCLVLWLILAPATRLINIQDRHVGCIQFGFIFDKRFLKYRKGKVQEVVFRHCPLKKTSQL